MLCADLETSAPAERERLARAVLYDLVMDLAAAVEGIAGRLPAPPQTILFAGSGEFLIPRVLERQRAFPRCRIVSLARALGPAVSDAACAHAVARLAAEEE